MPVAAYWGTLILGLVTTASQWVVAVAFVVLGACLVVDFVLWRIARRQAHLDRFGRPVLESGGVWRRRHKRGSTQ